MDRQGDPEALLAALDPEQREVATTLTGPVVVIAGAGTGKTRAITHRIAYGVATGVYNPTSVLAVTFTTRAAGELRSRLQSLGAVGVQARTFHSAALRQAQYFWPRIHGGELPQVLDNRMSLVAEAASCLRVGFDTARLRDLVSEIAWAKVSNVSATDYPRLAARHHRVVAAFDSETIARVFAAYETAKRERSRIDFEDILLCTAALISEHEEVADAVRRTYRHLVVDEYQDVSPLQEALLALWRGERADLCVVGDPAQTIHTFAGAQATYLTDFARRHPGARVIRLVRDYRSTPQVVAVANTIMGTGAGAGGAGLGAVALQAQRPAGPAASFTEAPDEAAEAAQLADWLDGRAASGVRWAEMAVLFRINAQSPPLEQALADRKIPYVVRSGERFYERPEVRQALMTLRTEARTDGAAGLQSDGAGQAGGLDRVRAVLAALGWTPAPPEGAGAVRERWESLAALFGTAQELVGQASPGQGRPAWSLADVSAELDRRAEAQHVPSAQGVTLSTLHGAKGLEWDAVAVYGVHEGSLPFVLATTPDQVAEERRLLYVGVTRARTDLRVSWSRSRNGGASTRQPSRFLEPVLPAGAWTVPAVSAGNGRRTRARTTVLSAHCRSCGQPLGDAAERKLGRHSGCPASYDEETLLLLKEWRSSQAKQQSVPAYCVFTDATLMAIAEACPRTPAELVKISGLGSAKASTYGEYVLAILGGRPAAASS